MEPGMTGGGGCQDLKKYLCNYNKTPVSFESFSYVMGERFCASTYTRVQMCASMVPLSVSLAVLEEITMCDSRVNLAKNLLYFPAILNCRQRST